MNSAGDKSSKTGVDLDALIDATDIARDRLCRACFDGVYPVVLPEPELLGKHVLEGIERRVERTTDADGVATVLGGGASDALERP